MPVRRRRQTAALLIALLLGAAGTPAVAGAQDGSVPDPSAIPQLGPATTATDETPATTPPATTTTTPSTPPAATTPTAADPQALPATGLDGRVLAGLGAGLLLCGLGLRLRTAREHF